MLSVRYFLRFDLLIFSQRAAVQAHVIVKNSRHRAFRQGHEVMDSLTLRDYIPEEVKP